MKYFCLAWFWVVLLLALRRFRVRCWKKLLSFGLTFSLLHLYLRIGLSTLNVVRFRNCLVCSCIFHTKSGDPARTCRLAWNYLALRNTDLDWKIKLINCKAWWILRKKITRRHWNRQPTIAKEIEERQHFVVREDLRLAYERMCDINKALEDSANGVKIRHVGLVFDEIRKWSDTDKQDFIPVRILRDKPKEALSDLEKQELHKKEEDWFNKKFELELALYAKKAAQEMSKPQAVKLQKYLITPFNGDYKDWLRFWNQFVVEVDNCKVSEISKFDYLLGLVEGEPRSHILGLPHKVEGYEKRKGS